ncbi:MAG TPA: polyphosphate kinase 2 family protein [Xanthobacteraceae bacterium]|jgi:PPK2 family polyphosphate:nucleotide phosphotransferase|nr:polyphosphate kinase 2 family protein [Xanthobacteraceae bacterium]
MKIPKHIEQYRVERAKGFRLADFDPADTGGLDIDKGEAKDILAKDIERLAELQQLLYAEHRWALLVIFQAMDAGGKDSAIAHVMSGVNPQGCDVHSFKQPSEEELAHDFMWRSMIKMPRRGHIGIFNRSYYEEVLVVRVHPEVLEQQGLPPALVSHHTWRERFRHIRNYEDYLVHNGILVIKFHLRISKEEQRRRFLARIEEPAKRWKFSMGDVMERRHWDRYMDAYERMIRHTATPQAPWYVVPADNKWFARLVVASALVHTLEGLHLKYPKVEGKALRALEKAKKALVKE